MLQAEPAGERVAKSERCIVSRPSYQTLILSFARNCGALLGVQPSHFSSNLVKLLSVFSRIFSHHCSVIAMKVMALFLSTIFSRKKDISCCGYLTGTRRHTGQRQLLAIFSHCCAFMLNNYYFCGVHWVSDFTSSRSCGSFKWVPYASAVVAIF